MCELAFELAVIERQSPHGSRWLESRCAASLRRPRLSTRWCVCTRPDFRSWRSEGNSESAS
jgi:hypothetical protein